jgi:rhodanese-related sulfurtransferase
MMKSITRTSLIIATLVGWLVGPHLAHADHLRDVNVVDATELKMWIDDHRKILLIDSRVASEYRAAHIPTSINVPANTMDQSRGKFPSDLSHVLVFYCNGWPECKKSHDASATAVGWGYRRVYWFRDGLPAWQARHYPVE